MNENTSKPGKSAKGSQGRKHAPAPVMSELELAHLGGGHVAYIKTLSYDEARRMFPNVGDLPSGITLYALHAADGTPIALTDTRQAALGHAMDGELEVASIH